MIQDVGLRAKLYGASAYVRDAESMQKATNKLGVSLDGTSSAASRIGSSLAKIGAAAGLAFGAYQLANLGKEMVGLAINAVESENLFTVSMGKMSTAATEWAKDTSQSLGLYETEVKRFLGTFNVMMTSMGLADDKAFQMSKGLTQLAYDMASFYNLSMEDAFQKLQSGISGEVEPLKRLGIIVNETVTKQAALKHGLIGVGEEMDEATKVTARYLAIMDQTSKAQGDMARTIDSPANALRRLESQTKQLGESLGQILVPALSTVVGWLNKAVSGLNAMFAASDNLDERLQKVQKLRQELASEPVAYSDMEQYSIIGKWVKESGLNLKDAVRQAELKYAEKLEMKLAVQIDEEATRAMFKRIDVIVSQLGKTLSEASQNVSSLDTQLRGLDTETNKAVADFNSWIGVLAESNGGAIDLAAHLFDVASASGTAAHSIDSMSASRIEVIEAAAANARDALNEMAGAAAKALYAASQATSTIDMSKGIFSAIAQAGKALDAKAKYDKVMAILSAPVPTYGGGIEKAAAALDDVTSGANTATDAMQALESAIRDCETAMRGLASVRLPGMQAAEDQMFELEMAIKRAKLGEMGMGDAIGQAARDLGDSFDLLAAQQREIEQGIPVAFQRYEQEYQDALRGAGQAAQGATGGGEGEKESDRLQRELEKLQLMYDLAYMPQQRLLTETMEDYLGENIEIPLSEALRMLKEQGTIYTGLNRQVLDMGGTLEDSSQWIGTIYDTRTSQIGIEGTLLDTYREQTIELGKQVALIGAKGTQSGAAVTAPLPGLADGGDIIRGGSVRVGERGPEIVTLAAGMRVLPAGVTKNVNSTRTYQDTYNVYQASQPWAVVDAIRKDSALRKLTAGRI